MACLSMGNVNSLRLGIVFYYSFYTSILGFLGGSDGEEFTCNAGDPGLIPGLGRCIEEGMATHSNNLAWRILWTEEPGGLASMGLQESDMT